MTNEQLKKVIAERLSFYKEVDSICDSTVSLKLECARLSQFIAALVLEYGGSISDDNWAQVSLDLNRFIPYRLSAGTDGVVITVTLDEATPA